MILDPSAPMREANLKGGQLCTFLQVMLGGMSDHLDEILRCRQLLMIASGSSYHSAMANQVRFKEVIHRM